MSSYVVLTKGVDPGRAAPEAGNLAKVLGYIGFGKIRTSPDGRDAAFEAVDDNRRKMEAEIAGELKYQARAGFVAIVLTSAEFATIAAEHPLADQGEAGNLYVTVLSHDPAREDVAMLMETMNGIDMHEVAGRAVYSRYGHGYESSRRSNEFIEKVMKVPAVLRTWAELQSLAALAAGPSSSSSRWISDGSAET